MKKILYLLLLLLVPLSLFGQGRVIPIDYSVDYRKNVQIRDTAKLDKVLFEDTSVQTTAYSEDSVARQIHDSIDNIITVESDPVWIGDSADYVKKTVLVDSLTDIREAIQTAGVKDSTFVSVKVNYLITDTAAATPPLVKGTSYWNEVAGTFDDVLGNGVILQRGQEMPIKVQNNTGSLIANGKATYVLNAGGEVERIALADNRYINTAYKFIGLTTSTISHGSTGYVTISGKVHGLNTGGFVEGEPIYLTTSGDWSQTIPATGHIIRIGFCTYAHASEGIITVAPEVISQTFLKVMNNDNSSTTIIDSTQILMKVNNVNVFRVEDNGYMTAEATLGDTASHEISLIGSTTNYVISGSSLMPQLIKGTTSILQKIVNGTNTDSVYVELDGDVVSTGEFRTPADTSTTKKALRDSCAAIRADIGSGGVTPVDGLLDWNGTAYAPYAAQQASLTFDNSITLPSLTGRLNLNGYLYATRLYAGGVQPASSFTNTLFNGSALSSGNYTFAPGSSANGLNFYISSSFPANSANNYLKLNGDFWVRYFNSRTLNLWGTTSGYTTIMTPAVSLSDTLILPTGGGTLAISQPQTSCALTDGAPTQAELVTCLGNASTTGTNLIFNVKDDSDGKIYLCIPDGTNWAYSLFTTPAP